MRFLHRRSTNGVAAVATVFATAAFLVQLAMPSALAASAPSNVGSFFPAASGPYANDQTGVTQMAVLSNLPNGVNTGAQLTAVTAHASTTAPVVTGATLVNWYYCNAGFTPPNVANCTLIGTDTTPTTPFETAAYDAAIPAGTAIDDAWSTIWNIPTTLTSATKDISVEACNGTPDATHSNCKLDTVTGVLLDGGGGPFPQTSSGVITSPTNGKAVSDQADLKMTASTSPELTAVGFGFNTADSGDDTGPIGDADVDTTGGSDDGGAYNDLAPDTTTATARTWSVTVPASGDLGTEIKNHETALTLWSTNGDMNFAIGGTHPQPGGVVSAVCGAPCTSSTVGGLALDRIYVVAEDGVPGKTSTVYVRQSSDVTADPTCTTGSLLVSAPAGSTVHLTGCAFDPFGTGVASEGVFWGLSTAGTGFFVGTPKQVTDTKGLATADVSAPTSAAGTQTTVTFCKDHDANGTCDTPAPAGDVWSASITINWSTVTLPHPRSVTLKLSDGLNAAGKVKAAGFAACAHNVPVKVQKRVGGSWKTLKSVKTSGTGTYKAHLANKHGKYRALAPRVTKGSAVCKRAVSPTRSH